MTGFLTAVPEPVWFAALGALGYKSLDFLELYKIPRAQWPNFGSFVYWLAVVVHVLLAGGLAYAYLRAGQTLGSILAINVGITAPFVLKTIASQTEASITVDPDA